MRSLVVDYRCLNFDLHKYYTNIGGFSDISNQPLPTHLHPYTRVHSTWLWWFIFHLCFLLSFQSRRVQTGNKLPQSNVKAKNGTFLWVRWQISTFLQYVTDCDEYPCPVFVYTYDTYISDESQSTYFQLHVALLLSYKFLINIKI